ncbi:MAG TPA: glucosidase [Lentisphaeria bacterium]|nr:MAG: glucosidase [Lentisphaerae bacterium GWF2_49_21]HBC89622.1 glucosidase [Lentisphaeria bacterium]
MSTAVEQIRLAEAREKKISWKKWGPYLSERQWGTVREDYSDHGNSWVYFTHDQARSRAYRWGEDGIAGISDDKQKLCFCLALWNGKDPIIKERLFGLDNTEGNHGEDVKEYYFYLDSTPTHSYMKYLYKYPHNAYPYDQIVKCGRGRSRKEWEYELMETGIFKEDRYFDVFVEYAKASAEDILIRITVCNRGSQNTSLHLLPSLWFRNTWTWSAGSEKPVMRQIAEKNGTAVIEAVHKDIGRRYLYCRGPKELLFTENETNTARLFGMPNRSPYVKDGINNYIIDGAGGAVNPKKTGTKACAHFNLKVEAGKSRTVCLRLNDIAPAGTRKADGEGASSMFGSNFDEIFKARINDADEFYRNLTPSALGADEAMVMRQAFAGMLWSKQYYCFDAVKWLREHDIDPLSHKGRALRNKEWFHMNNDDIISMPDKWEYPWYAAWDLAFQSVVLAEVDIDFAKEQMDMMLKETYMHPSGQLPAYEWNFSDVNPPVHAWAIMFLYNLEKQKTGKGDLEFLKRSFSKMLLNFTWWVNRKDRFGKNVFEGGFLGLDNIGVFDRSAPLPTGGYIEQADGTAWMSLFCINMFDIASELAAEDRSYCDMILKFMEHFLWIATGINHKGGDGLWDEEDGFYYDLLRLPNGESKRLKVRSMVGLLPFCAVSVIGKFQRERVPEVYQAMMKRLEVMPEIMDYIHPTGPDHLGNSERGMLSLLNKDKLKRILSKLLDENEFFGPYGIRALSKYHEKNPYVLNVGGQEFRVDYLPGESDSGMFGGNSNWRGPVWMPVNCLIIRALLQYYLYYGDDFKVECPTGSGKYMTLFDASKELSRRLSSIFLRNKDGKRPVFGGNEVFQNDPYWRDNILFYEYFHGDCGAGLGASHQTGWTGSVATLIKLFGHLVPGQVLDGGKRTGFINKNEKTEKK